MKTYYNIESKETLYKDVFRWNKTNYTLTDIETAIACFNELVNDQPYKDILGETKYRIVKITEEIVQES